MLSQELTAQAEKIIHFYIEKQMKLATAESCTGGLVAAALTSIPGSSLVVERGYVTYSNAAKQQDLGVPVALLEKHGAVSEEVAAAMAQGMRDKTGVDIALSITGVAGPSGGSAEKPVGLVYIALAAPLGVEARRFKFDGDRAEIRRQAVVKALSWLLAAAKGEG